MPSSRHVLSLLIVCLLIGVLPQAIKHPRAPLGGPTGDRHAPFPHANDAVTAIGSGVVIGPQPLEILMDAPAVGVRNSSALASGARRLRSRTNGWAVYYGA